MILAMYIPIYPIVKLILFIATIVCVVKDKKKNINKDRINNVLNNYMIFAVVIYYICTVITDIIALFGDIYILWFAPIPITIIFLVIFLSSRKGNNKDILSVFLLVLIIVSMIFNTLKVVQGMENYYYKENRNAEDNIEEKEVDAHNSEYEAYFGDRVSAANTKALLQKIKTNNTLYEANGNVDDIMPICVVFKPYNSNQKIIDYKMNSIISLIKSSRHYKISVYNEETTDEDPEFERDEENSVKLKIPEDLSGYYSNGYIRVVLIEELESESVKNKIQ